MSSQKIIVVTDATGKQGVSVTRFLLEDGTFAVRAVTRSPESPAAKGLVAQGAQVVKADSSDLASLLNVFEGAYGVFGLTSYSEPGSDTESERIEGKALVDVAKITGVKHFVWSTLDHSEFKVVDWESKADVDDYLKASGIPWTSLYTSFYYENFVGRFRFRKREDGSYDFPAPMVTDAPFAVYSAADTGAWVLAAFKNPEKWVGQDMRIAAEFLSAREMGKTVANISGKKIHVQEVSHEQFESFKGNLFPKEKHSNMKLVFHYNKPPFRDPVLAQQLYPETKTFHTWATENIDKLLE